MAGRFHLLEGVSSFQQFVEDPALADRRKAFEEHPRYDVPAVATRMEEIPGPHGPVPARIYTPDRTDNAPCLVWMHGGAFIGGDPPHDDVVAAFPALAALDGLCPALVINAEYDDLRASGEAFSAALALASVDVRQVQVKTMLHGFLNLAANLEPVSAALDLIARTVKCCMLSQL
jgi:acetyl esterase/lipase